MSAFVFNCDYNGLAIIQSLGRHGVNVFALDAHRSIGTRSRFATYKGCPDPLTEETKFVRFLLEEGRHFCDKPLLFPTNDHWLLAVSRHKAELEEYFHCCAPDRNTAELLLDKGEFARWAVGKSLPTPRTWVADVNNLEQAVEFPVVVKPVARRISGNDSQGAARARHADAFRLRTCNSRADLADVMLEADGKGIECLIQEKVSGDSSDMYTVGIFAVAGTVKGLFSGRKVRGFPPAYGDCVVGESYRVPNSIVDLCRNIANALGYTGIAELEFMRDRRTWEFKLIEINPRSWSWIGITPAAGIDLAWLAYRHFVLGEDVPYQGNAVADGAVRYAKILQDVQNCVLWNKNQGGIHWRMGIWSWLKDYRGKKIVAAEFAWDDPMISLYSSAQAANLFIRRLRQG